MSISTATGDEIINRDAYIQVHPCALCVRQTARRRFLELYLHHLGTVDAKILIRKD